MLIFGAGFLWPLGRVVLQGFFSDGSFTLEYVLGVFRNPV